MSGTITLLASAAVVCRNRMTLRWVRMPDRIHVFVDGIYLTGAVDSSVATGKPGIGVRNAPAANTIAQVQMGPFDRVLPGPASPATCLPTRWISSWQALRTTPMGSVLQGVAEWGAHCRCAPSGVQRCDGGGGYELYVSVLCHRPALSRGLGTRRVDGADSSGWKREPAAD